MYPGEHAERHPDQPALIMATSGATLTFAEFEANANRLAHLYRAAGLRRGDHVAFLMENHLRYFETMSAAERCGLYYTCINSYLTPEEIAYIVDDCDAKLFITSQAKADVAVAAVAMTPKVETFLCVDADGEIGPFRPYDEALAAFPTTRIPDEQLGAAMLYSSGTTGRPKGILRPLPDAHPSDALPVMQFIVDRLFHMREGMTYLSPAPIYHSAPQASVACALRLGATSVIMERFDPEQYLALVEQHRITHSQVVPTMFSRLLKLPEEARERYDISSLEVIIHAAAPCPVPVKQAMIDWFGPKLVEYYGATEANGFTFCDSEQWLAHPGTVGAPILGTLLILDDDGKEVPTGETGTVWFDGATNFTYYHDEAKTAESRDETRTALDGRRRRLRRRRRLPLPHRPQDVHDHLRRREHLPAGGREPPRHPREGVRCGGHRRAQRGQGRGGQGGRPGDAWHRTRPRAGARADRLLPPAPRRLQVPPVGGLRGRAAPAADGQAVQAPAPRPLLGRQHVPHRVSSDNGRTSVDAVLDD